MEKKAGVPWLPEGKRGTATGNAESTATTAANTKEGEAGAKEGAEEPPEAGQEDPPSKVVPPTNKTSQDGDTAAVKDPADVDDSISGQLDGADDDKPARQWGRRDKRQQKRERKQMDIANDAGNG